MPMNHTLHKLFSLLLCLALLLSLVGPARIRVRVPRIPEYNTAEDQARSAAALRALGVETVELFDYVIRPDA